MKSYKNANELIKDYNTLKVEGGLMGEVGKPRIEVRSIEEWVNWEAGRTITSWNGHTLTANGQGRFIRDNGELGGCGASDLVRRTFYVVVADKPSGSFVFEVNYGEYSTLAEAQDRLAEL